MTDDREKDEVLISRCRQGDRTALECIMEKYKPLVIKKARSMFLIGGETEDLIQEGMIGLFKAVQETSFYRFSKLCIDRQIYSAVTSAGRKKHSPLNGYVSLSDSEELEWEERWRRPAVSTVSPEEALINRERMEMIQEKLGERLSSLSGRIQLRTDGG